LILHFFYIGLKSKNVKLKSPKNACFANLVQ
jgi:hypothetical protein